MMAMHCQGHILLEQGQIEHHWGHTKHWSVHCSSPVVTIEIEVETIHYKRQKTISSIFKVQSHTITFTHSINQLMKMQGFWISWEILAKRKWKLKKAKACWTNFASDLKNLLPVRIIVQIKLSSDVRVHFASSIMVIAENMFLPWPW